MPQLPKTPPDPDEKIKPTPPAVMAVLILILLGLMVATGKAVFYPNPPAVWKTLHEKPDLPMADVNKILSDSGAIIDSVKAVPEGSIETWRYQHRTGSWQIIVNLKKSPAGVVYASEQVRCEITHFPSFTRVWDYPPLPPGTVPAPAPTAAAKASTAAPTWTLDPAPAPTPAPEAPAAAPAK